MNQLSITYQIYFMSENIYRHQEQTQNTLPKLHCLRIFMKNQYQMKTFWILRDPIDIKYMRMKNVLQNIIFILENVIPKKNLIHMRPLTAWLWFYWKQNKIHFLFHQKTENWGWGRYPSISALLFITSTWCNPIKIRIVCLLEIIIMMYDNMTSCFWLNTVKLYICG